MTAAGAMHLSVDERITGDRSVRTARLRAAEPAIDLDVIYDVEGARALRDASPLDGFVFGMLLYAMSVGKPLVVHGALSRTALRNIDELQRAWHRWKPERYRRIDVTPERVVDVPLPALRTAIAAFSGGVDSSFTALAQTRADEARSLGLTTVLMVHGFDVDLKNAQMFERLRERVAPFLDALGLQVRVVRTNSKALNLQTWGDSHGLELAACLHQHAEEFRFGLIGSTEPYDGIIFPWGSTPATDHLMSGDAFAIVHDGSGFIRTEKIAELAKHPVARRTLKVCWQGADQAVNCGRCGKCVRTQLSFYAAGDPDPPCFGRTLTADDVDGIPEPSRLEFAAMRSILAFADARGVDGPPLRSLRRRLDAWEHPEKTARGRVRAILAASRLLEPVRTIRRVLGALPQRVTTRDRPRRRARRPSDSV